MSGRTGSQTGRWFLSVFRCPFSTRAKPKSLVSPPNSSERKHAYNCSRNKSEPPVEGTVRAFNIRAEAQDRYRGQLADGGSELVRIATVAYQEGEIGILQLLDAYRSQRQAQLRMLDIQAAVKEAQIELERVIGEDLGK